MAVLMKGNPVNDRIMATAITALICAIPMATSCISFIALIFHCNEKFQETVFLNLKMFIELMSFHIYLLSQTIKLLLIDFYTMN